MFGSVAESLHGLVEGEVADITSTVATPNFGLSVSFKFDEILVVCYFLKLKDGGLIG
jgi:hypothetical protein